MNESPKSLLVARDDENENVDAESLDASVDSLNLGIPSFPADYLNEQIPSQAIAPITVGGEKTDAVTFVQKNTPLFANSVFCLIREDPKKKQATGPAVMHSTGLTAQSMLDFQRNGYAIYFSVNGFRDGKRDSAHLIELKALYVDIDCPKELKNIKRETATFAQFDELRRFKRESAQRLFNDPVFPFKPTLVVETRNGIQAFWFFAEPLQVEGESDDDVDKAAISTYLKTLKSLGSLFNGDPNARDVARVLRLPYSWHLQNGMKDPFPVQPVYFNPENVAFFEEYAGAFVDLAAIEQSEARDADKTAILAEDSFLASFVKAKYPSAVDLFEARDFVAIEESVLKAYPKRDRPSIRGLMNPGGVSEGSRNMALFIVVSALREDGFARGDVEADLLSQGFNGLPEKEIQSVIASAYKTIRPRSFGWGNPIASMYRTDIEESQVRALYRDAIEKRLRVIRDEKGISLKELKDRPNEEAPRAVAPKALPVDAGGNPINAPISYSSDEQSPVYQDLLPQAQKKIFETVEYKIAEAYPEVRYLEGIGFHERVKNADIYKAITDDDLARRISKFYRAIGLTIYQTTSQCRAKILPLSSLSGVLIPSEHVEPGIGRGNSLDHEDVLPVKNGVLNLKRGVLLPYSEQDAWRFQSGVTFEYEAQCPLWLEFIKSISDGDENKAKLLQEIAGYCLTSSTAFQTAFVFLGEGSNGKSVFANVISSLLGPELASSISIETLQSHFGAIGVDGKRLNVVTEISDHYLKADIFKRLVDGSSMTVDRKNKELKTITPFVKLIFTVNRFPQVDESSHAVYRRLFFVKFTRIFSGSEVIVDLEDRLRNELPGILNWALQGLARLRQNKAFSVPSDHDTIQEEFRDHSSHVLTFIKEQCMPAKGESLTIGAFLERFNRYCEVNNYRKMTAKRVTADIQSLISSKSLARKFPDVQLRNAIIDGLKLKNIL